MSRGECCCLVLTYGMMLGERGGKLCAVLANPSSYSRFDDRCFINGTFGTPSTFQGCGFFPLSTTPGSGNWDWRNHNSLFASVNEFHNKRHMHIHTRPLSHSNTSNLSSKVTCKSICTKPLCCCCGIGPVIGRTAPCLGFLGRCGKHRLGF